MLRQLVRECGAIYQVYQQHNVAAMNSVCGKNVQDILSKLNDDKLSKFLCKQIKDETKKTIHYFNAQSCPQNTFSIGIFVLGENSMLPLHDHPLMVVATKVLSGIGRLETFTLQSNHQIQLSYPRLDHYHCQQSPQNVTVKDHHIDQVEQGQIIWTYPTDKNIHSFSNIYKPKFIFLDVIVPYYDFKDRFCNYYERSTDEQQLLITCSPQQVPDIRVIDINLDLNEFFD